MNTDMIAKRVRRCEISNLTTAEEIAEIRMALRAIYEALIALSRRVTPIDNFSADPIDILLCPSWHTDEATGNILPPPDGVNIETGKLGAIRLYLNRLSDEQATELSRRRLRHKKHLEMLIKREEEREARLKKENRRGPDVDR